MKKILAILSVGLLCILPGVGQMSAPPTAGYTSKTTLVNNGTTQTINGDATANQDNVGLYNGTQPFTMLLPTASAGKVHCLYNTNHNGSSLSTSQLNFQTSASGQFVVDALGNLGNDWGFITSTGGNGDFGCVVGVDSTHWQVFKYSGTWTIGSTPSGSPRQQTSTLCKWSTGTTFTCSLGSNALNGNILVGMFGGDVNVSLSSITETNVTWVQAWPGTQINRDTEIWCGKVTGSSNSTITVNLNGTPSDFSGNISEWGSMFCPPMDSPENGSSSGVFSVASVITTQDVANHTSSGAIFNVLSNVSQSLSSGPTDGFTALNTASANTEHFAYKVFTQTTPGTLFHTSWTLSGANNYDWTIVAIK